MKATKGIHMLSISANLLGEQRIIHPTLIWDEETVILVDAGYPGQLPLIREAAEQAGVPFERLDKVIVTHQDLDHIGSLPSIVKETPHKVEILAHELEKPYIQGERRLLKITDEALAQIDNWPGEHAAAFKRLLANPPKAEVDRTVAGGEELPFCGGIVIIDTPGHTPGHISIYHKNSRTLIAADAMIVEEGLLLGADPRLCTDPALALRSLNNLLPFEIDSVICYHGGMVGGDIGTRIRELASE